MKQKEAIHSVDILDQFARQATTFAAVQARASQTALQLLEDTIGVNSEDDVLDVACGPGIVSSWLAKRAKFVTGIDVVPAMIESAHERKAAEGLANIDWKIGNIYDLPFTDNAFSVVVTRFSFHHLLEPCSALAEMVRVCRPGGRICVADVTPEAGKEAAYDVLEKLRDPSHVRALSWTDLLALANNDTLALKAATGHRLEISLDAQLASSFPTEGKAEIIRQMVRQDIGVNRLSIDAFEKGNEIILRIPVSIVVWEKRDQGVQSRRAARM